LYCGDCFATKLPNLPTGIGLPVQYMMFLAFLAWVIWHTSTGISYYTAAHVAVSTFLHERGQKILRAAKGKDPQIFCTEPPQT